MSVTEDIKYRLRQNNAVYKIILINVLVFLVIAIISLSFSLFNAGLVFNNFIEYFMLPAAYGKLIYQPWSLFTYFFLHLGLLHLVFNMLWFYWFGHLFQQYLGNTKTYIVYITGAILGGILYVVSYNSFPVFAERVVNSTALGASAGVLAIVVATATLLPDYQFFVFIIGPVRLKYIALVSVILDLISITGVNADNNSGGHIAHLGGATFGYFYIKFLYSKSNFALAINTFFEQIIGWFKPKPQLKIHYKSNYMRVEENVKPSEQEIDAILDKISKHGYESLNKKEKEILEKASKD